ncbi:MAG: ABC transporter ATP-binding protein [Chloroflexi bacterium]|nr:ABC transporter ATP-binding protein [Chloroflexota bacterium]MCA2002760.1 ABC transporter ATP-binding protein [Chloroflexota bacterium]
MLELRDIFKTYEGSPLLRGISFSVVEGETVCLLGASGSGKSTLLRMIAGLENPERGQILFNGLDLAQIPTHLRDFGLVFQDYGLFPHLNVFDNVAFGLRMRNLRADEINSRVAALLKKVNLTGFESRKTTDLSGGEQQRVALARALAPQPRLLMFDEPLGALDRTLKESLLQELRSILHETKIPAIYVTHDQDEAFAVADRILLLHEGEIVRAGTPAQVWSDPGSPWAARFLDAGNVLEGVIKRSDEGGRMKVETAFGDFFAQCERRHRVGETVSLLVRQSSGGGQEINLKAEDALFKRDQFEVRGEGLVFQMKEAPVVGQVVKVKVEVKCLV